MKLKPRPPAAAKPRRFEGMVLVRGGAFLMGSDNFYPDERPVRPATVGDFWIDETPVTNAAFARFVEATGYVTFAERPPDPRDYPGMDAAMARAGSAVFIPPATPVDPAAPRAGPPPWWAYIFGADWKHPIGPDSAWEAIPDHPVVHVVAQDAEAYAAWARKNLPTEVEWEYAARAGSTAAYAWGDDFEPSGRSMAKTWAGDFPNRNEAPPGLERTAPVKNYPPDAFGLYDMIGNVWEWTADWYAGASVAQAPCCGAAARSAALPEGRGASADAAGTPRRVLKGGSHLCAPNYCQRYRPAARWPQPVDTSTSHVGFRCVVRR